MTGSSGSFVMQRQAHSPSGPPGIPGDPQSVNVTMTVVMMDDMRFKPSSIGVTAGDTVRFVLENAGKLRHEFVLGTMEELQAHSEMMKQSPGMEHSAPNMATVPPGQQREIIWRFMTVGRIAFGCLQPGHLEAGMVGSIDVKPRFTPKRTIGG
jgi:uncharacterized cupredoxin-like copper-binding protein